MNSINLSNTLQKRDGGFNRLRKETAPGSSGDKSLSRRNIREASLDSILTNWIVFQKLREGFVEGRVDSEVRGRVIRIQTQI